MVFRDLPLAREVDRAREVAEVRPGLSGLGERFMSDRCLETEERVEESVGRFSRGYQKVVSMGNHTDQGRVSTGREAGGWEGAMQAGGTFVTDAPGRSAAMVWTSIGTSSRELGERRSHRTRWGFRRVSRRDVASVAGWQSGGRRGE